jgi:hypothetical protein
MAAADAVEVRPIAIGNNDSSSTSSLPPSGSSFCATPFWDWELLTHQTRPDLTECYHATVVLLPCIFIWAFLPYYISLFLR